MEKNHAITICTTVCAIPSHPDTRIIDTVHESVRHYLPRATHLFLFDGLHPIHEDMRRSYGEHKQTLKTRIDSGAWNNCEYVVFDEWRHQAGMIREAIGRIKTPLVLWLEHDFAFNGLPIDWDGITQSLLDNEVCYLRFMLPEETQETLNGHYCTRDAIPSKVPMMQIMAYSSLPHVCHRDFLERLVREFKEGKCHLECNATEAVAYEETQWKLAVYTPAGKLARFYSLDGRAGGNKPPAVI